MKQRISERLSKIIEALPLREGMRVLEIGCGTGQAAKAITVRFETVYVLGIDRSEKAIKQSTSNCATEIAAGKIKFFSVSAEAFQWQDKEKFDLAFAIRVGALDGRHPEIEMQALMAISKALKPGAKLFIDSGDSVKEIDIKAYR